MKKKYCSLFIALSLLFSGNTIAYAAEPVEVLPVNQETIAEITKPETATTEVEEKISEETLELPTTIATLRIETASGGELFNDEVTVTSCKPYAAATEYTLNAKCLIDQASGLTSVWDFYGTDAFLNSVNEYSNDFGANLFWGYFINNEYGSIALNAYTLGEGDEIVLVYGVNPLKIEMESLTPALNSTTTVHVYEFGLDEFWNPVWIPSNSSTVKIDGVEYSTSANGLAEVKFNTHDSHMVEATKDGFAKSNTLTIETKLPTIEAKLYAVANGNILFHNTVEVTSCKPYAAATEYTLNAKCLIDQASGLTSVWDFYGTDAFLNSVNEYSNDFGANLFWGYFINNEYGSIALNAYTLGEGDEILIQYNTIPLKLELSNYTPVVGDSVTISVHEFGLDEFWNPIWIPSTSSTLTINGVGELRTSSTLTLPITTTSPYTIRVEKNGYVTQEITLTAGAAPTPPPSSGSSGGSNGSSSGNTSPTQSMINFLDAKQNPNGSFGTTAFLSDWAAIAYGAWTGGSTGASKLTSYLLSNPNPLDGPNKITNYARRAMALMALGINPYTGTQTNYISEIIKGFDGTQFGDVGLVNDDIFALTPLLRSGYSSNDTLIVSTTKYIIGQQDTHGSFGSIDLTGAAIQSLSELSSVQGVSDALAKAKNYLKSAEQSDGGFGNVYATSWVMQGIASLGESSANWSTSGNTPVTYIQSKQAVDGGMLLGDTDANRIWATSYALPGLLGKPWHTILTSFNKPTSENNSTGNGDAGTTTSTATTTVPTIITTPTSTPTSTSFTSTTPEVISIEPMQYTYTEASNETSPNPAHSEPARGAVLGEKEENTERTNEPDTKEGVVDSEAETISNEVNENPQTKKYIFVASLTILLCLVGYALFRGKASKK